MIDQLAEMGVDEIGLIGGEPLIIPGVVDLMRRIKSNGMRLSLNTNATLLAKHMKAVCEFVDVLYVSVDAADSRHDSIRGIDGLLERVLKATREVVDYKRQHKLERPEIHFHCTLTKTNVDGIRAMVELGESVGVDVVSFHLLTSTPQPLVDKTIFDGECIASDIFTVNNITSLALDDEGVAAFREEMSNIPKTRHVKTIVTPVKNLSDAALKSGRFPVKRCAPVVSSIGITPTGEAAICPALRYSIGNVRQAGMREIWNGSRHRKLEAHLKKKFFPVCAELLHVQQLPDSRPVGEDRNGTDSINSRQTYWGAQQALGSIVRLTLGGRFLSKSTQLLQRGLQPLFFAGDRRK